MVQYGTTDLDAAAQAHSQQSQSVWWSPKEGRNLIRVLPPWSANEKLPWVAATYHRRVPPVNQEIMCLRETKKVACFICERMEQLFETSDPASARLVREMAPRFKALFNILDLDNLGAGVLILGCGRRVCGAVTSYMNKNSDWGDITHPEKGFDIEIFRKGVGINTEYTVQARRQPTPLPDMTVLTRLHNLKNYLMEVTYEEQRLMYEGLPYMRVRQMRVPGASSSAAPTSRPQVGSTPQPAASTGPTQSVPRNMIKCPLPGCNMTFATAQQLGDHIQTVHAVGKPETSGSTASGEDEIGPGAAPETSNGQTPTTQASVEQPVAAGQPKCYGKYEECDNVCSLCNAREGCSKATAEASLRKAVNG